MTEKDLEYFKNWFSDFTKSFYSSNEEDQKNIMLKVDHTRNVCKNIIEITNDLSLDDNDKRLAETLALFHDVGRFPQYAKYKTFRDADSINHGLLGTKTLIHSDVLGQIPKDEQDLIKQVVKFHCALTIPKSINNKTLFFLKMIRDADKLDIWRVFIVFYEAPEEERASATAHNKPDTPEYSKDILLRINDRKIASYSKVKNINDFKLMKLSWVYDLHFNGSFRLLKERDYIKSLAQKLPQTNDILKAVAEINKYISERLQSVQTK
ncbi:MAG: HD domain-containing protein [Nitrospirae bacterium]|nr:HD domain-containing protein [Nitrospirota bacterium]